MRTRVDGRCGRLRSRRVLRRTSCPGRLDDHATDIVPALPFIRPRPLVVEVDGEAWTLDADDDRVVDHARRDGARRPRTCSSRADQLADLVDDQQTFMSLWASGTLDQQRGQRRPSPRLVARVARRARRHADLHARLDRARRPRRAPARPHARVPAPTTIPTRCGTSSQTAGFLHIERLFTTPRWTRSRPTWTAPRRRTPKATAARGGRAPADGDSRLVRMQGFDRESRRRARAHRRRPLPRSRVDPGRGPPLRHASARTTASRRCSSRSASPKASPTSRGTRTAASAVTRTTAAVSPSASR